MTEVVLNLRIDMQGAQETLKLLMEAYQKLEKQTKLTEHERMGHLVHSQQQHHMLSVYQQSARQLSQTLSEVRKEKAQLQTQLASALCETQRAREECRHTAAQLHSTETVRQNLYDQLQLIRTFGGKVLPAPLRVMPPEGSQIWLLNTASEHYTVTYSTVGSRPSWSGQYNMLANGFAFATKEDAEANLEFHRGRVR